MDKTELLSAIDEFLKDIQSSKEVELYHHYLSSIHELKIDEIKKRSDSLKMEAKKQPYEMRKKMLQEAKDLYDQYEEHPLVLNARSVRQEIMDSLSPLNKLGGL